MSIWNGFDEADIAIHQDELAAEKAEHKREEIAEYEAGRAEAAQS